MEVYLVRHTQPNVDKNICYGQLDLALAESFENDFHTIQSKLPLNVDIIYTSPLERCVELSKKIADAYQYDIKNYKADTRLMELNFGEWEGKSWDDIDKNILGEWMSNFVKYRVPGGENFEDLYERAMGFWEREIKQNSENSYRMLIVSHAGFIRTLLCYLQNIPLDKAFNIAIDFGSISKINITTEGIKIDYINH